jgi:CRP-like cAMP-binding protein
MHRSNKSFKRTATAISKGETHTAILSKEDFQRVCLEQIERRFEKIIKFLMGFSICQGINKGTLSQLSYYLKERQLIRRNVLFKEGQEADGIYFI